MSCRRAAECGTLSARFKGLGESLVKCVGAPECQGAWQGGFRYANSLRR
jgi:hypothetical protein